MGARTDIVAGVDATPEGSMVAALAAAEADRRRVGLRLLCARADEGSRLVIDRLAPAVRHQYPELDITVDQTISRVADELVELSRDATLIAVTRALAGGHDPVLDRWLPDRALTHAHCPVLVAPHGPQRSQKSPLPVMVGVDGSDFGVAAARLAFEAATLRQAPLHAITVHCVPPRPHDAASHSGQYDARTAQANAEDLLATTLAPLADEYPAVRVSADARYAPDVGAALVEASEGADLIVVGALGRGPVTCVVLGPVSHALVERSACPVLIAHAARHPAAA